MMMNAKNAVLAGIPADYKERMACGIAEYVPPPGAKVFHCVACARLIYLGVRQQEKLAQGVPAACPRCLAKGGANFSPDNVKSLGGESGQYKLL